MHVESELGPDAERFTRWMLESGRSPGIDDLMDRALSALAEKVEEEDWNAHIHKLAQEGIDSGPAEPFGPNWKEELKASVPQRRTA